MCLLPTQRAYRRDHAVSYCTHCRAGSFIDPQDVPSVVDKRNLKENAQRAYDEEHEQLVGRIHAVQRRQEDLLLKIVEVIARLDFGCGRLLCGCLMAGAVVRVTGNRKLASKHVEAFDRSVR